MVFKTNKDDDGDIIIIIIIITWAVMGTAQNKALTGQKLYLML